MFGPSGGAGRGGRVQGRGSSRFDVPTELGRWMTVIIIQWVIISSYMPQTAPPGRGLQGTHHRNFSNF